MTYGAVTVTSSATPIIVPSSGRRNFVVYNAGVVDLYIGFDSSVTTSTGMTVLPGSTYSSSGDPEGWRGPVYGIVSSGTTDVRYQEW
jgi:hypothetical protein